MRISNLLGFRTIPSIILPLSTLAGGRPGLFALQKQTFSNCCTISKSVLFLVHFHGTVLQMRAVQSSLTVFNSYKQTSSIQVTATFYACFH